MFGCDVEVRQGVVRILGKKVAALVDYADCTACVAYSVALPKTGRCA